MKKLTTFAVLACLALGLSACSTASPEEQALQAMNEFADELESLAQQDKICESEVTAVSEAFEAKLPAEDSNVETDMTAEQQEQLESLTMRIAQSMFGMMMKVDSGC